MTRVVTARPACAAAALWMAVVALALGGCGGATAPAAPSAGAAPRGIVVLGDSLAVSPTRAEAFPAVLQAKLVAMHPGWTIDNESVSGDTTADGVRRLDAALAPDTAILVLELGANDGLRGVPIATIESNLSALIERAKARSIRVLLCGMETPPFHGFRYSADYHAVFPRLAAKHSVPLVPFLLEGVALNPDLNGDDRIHPNAAGARRIADIVWPHLEPLVRQATSAAVSR
jgi:acyl-CoA thioesterase I